MKDAKEVLFVGDGSTLYMLSGYEHFFQKNGFCTFKAKTFEEAVQVLLARSISLVVVYAYGDRFSEPIDNYTGKLPPIIYWNIPYVDTAPKREGVHCVDNATLPSEVFKLAEELLKA